MSTKGIIVIETKNYKGRIYGDYKDEYWTQVLAYGHTKNKVYNPIKQNNTHIKVLASTLKISKPNVFTNLVVLLRNNKDYIHSYEAVNYKELKNFFSVYEAKEDILTKEEVDSIFNTLLAIKNSKQITNKEHTNNIKNNHYTEVSELCPLCGGKLIKRYSNKYHSYFYGCSNYPKCRYIKNK